jgi:hypothetical protein
MTSAIRSRGVIYKPLLGRDEIEDIPADRWAQWTFLPTFKGPLSEKMRAKDWLVPNDTALSRVCRGFGDIVLLRKDVERLAAPVTIEHEAVSTGEGAAVAPPKPGLLDDVVAVLREKFPGRPRHKREALLDIVRKELGVGDETVSLETLKRAMAHAWPVAQNGSK